MKKTLALLAGIAAGAALTAAISYTKRGKEVRSNLSKRTDELRQKLAGRINRQARKIKDSEITYI